MALLKAEAEKLSNNDLVAGIIEEMIDRDDLLALLPFVGTKGKAYVYNREDETDMVDHLNQGGTPGISFLDPNDAVPERATKFVEVTTNLRIIAGDVDVDKFLQTTMDDTNAQKAIQIAKKVKLIARLFRQTMAIGDNGTNAKEFDGVAQLVTAGQTINMATDGAALTIDKLDELLDKVPYGADAIMMRSGTYRAYKALLRSFGGNTAEMIMIENFGMMPAHNGVPIIINDFLPANETLGIGTSLCSIYVMRLNEVDGLHGLYGGEAAGIVVEDIGTVQNKDATRTRVKWYCGAALKSTKSLARLQGVTNI